jgi:PPM family protein phosphatase
VSLSQLEGVCMTITALVSLTWAAVSVTGLVREGNEDSLYAGRRLFAIADGMGGHAAGEVASAAVIESLRLHDREVAADELLEVLGRAVGEANAEIARRAAEDVSRRGMGTTLTALLWSGDVVAVGNIGDSRGFRLRDGQLRLITEDHVMGRLLSNAGALAPVLARYLDGSPYRSPDLGLRELRCGDRYLLCSDGLSPVVSNEAIGGVLVAAASSGEAVRHLVALAESAGAPDNVSAIVIDVTEADADVGGDAVEPVTLGAAAGEVVKR